MPVEAHRHVRKSLRLPLIPWKTGGRLAADLFNVSTASRRGKITIKKVSPPRESLVWFSVVPSRASPPTVEHSFASPLVWHLAPICTSVVDSASTGTGKLSIKKSALDPQPLPIPPEILSSQRKRAVYLNRFHHRT